MDNKKSRIQKPRIREVPAVSRALAILRWLGNTGDPASLKTIASALSLVPSTCLHILRVLVAEGLVRVDEDTKRYTLGSGMLSLARSVIERSSFTTLVQPSLDSLVQIWGLTTMGVEIQSNGYAIVLALARSPTPFGLHTDVGSRFPSLVSATGRLVAAFGDPDWTRLRKQFKSLPWDKPVDFATWRKEVEVAKKRGFSVDRDRYMSGITVVAVPVLTGGRMTHTLVCAGLSERLDLRQITSLAEDMSREARRLSLSLVPRG
jgi:DNA-binding IclR family transcriptional regulator